MEGYNYHYYAKIRDQKNIFYSDGIIMNRGLPIKTAADYDSIKIDMAKTINDQTGIKIKDPIGNIIIESLSLLSYPGI